MRRFVAWAAERTPRTLGILGVASVPLAVFVFVDLPLREHLVLSLLVLGAALMVARYVPRHRVAVALLSIAVSARYIWWRGTHTLVLDPGIDGLVGAALYGAELFGFLLLVAGYFQTAFTRARAIVPLPDDAAELPWVDVFVPTYNEDVAILRRTLVGAVSIDYPKKRVWLLDERKRPEMRALTEELGCDYMTRPDNRGAKAGNLNHALAHTTGELVCVFDADQVPVRSFLRLTVPPFLENPKLALVQTPHHFYNPDPFERNLHLEGVLPPEQVMFYHVIQTGNDFWNSSFFCGSSAVLRREALVSVGGIATETVTEDAHTALRMHAAGWDSAYVAVPQAAGLATERFAFHVSQRIRWARGMVQILRLDNPLLRRGLTLAQRVNYFTAACHFLFGLPRMIYLLAPPAYLVFGVHPLEASALAIGSYALPHVALSILGSSTVARTARHSFWAEVYETAIAPYVAAITILTVIAPRHGKFNVTAKGARLEKVAFDARNALPNLVVGGVVLLALVATPVRLWTSPADVGTVLLAGVWNAYNAVLLFAAILVALDRPQRRRDWRVRRSNRVRVRQDAREWEGRIMDLSEGGARVRVSGGGPTEGSVALSIQSELGAPVEVVAHLLEATRSEGSSVLRCAFDGLDPAQSRGLIEQMFVAANAWIHFPVEPDRPLHSALEVLTAPWRALARALR